MRWCERVAAVAIAAWLAGCLPGHSQAPAPLHEEETAIFAAALAGAVSRRQQEPLVDPRPLRLNAIDGGGGMPRLGDMLPDTSDYVDASANVIRGRRAVLDSLGLPAVAAVPIRENCPGYLASSDAGRQGCPDGSEIHLAFDMPSSEGAAGPFVPMIQIDYSSRGRGVTYFRVYVARSEDGAWTYLREEAVLSVD